MNDEKLIGLVRAQPVLYDISHRKYMDSNFKNKIWSKLGAEMKTDWSSCKSRWTNIRDNFRKSLNKARTKRGSKIKKAKQYKYSQELEFLVEGFEESEGITNLQREGNDQVATVKEETCIEDVSPNSEENEQDCAEEIAAEKSAALVIADVRSQNAFTFESTGSESISQNKMKLPDETTPETPAATLMEYIVEKNDKTSDPFPVQDPVDAFLAGIAPALKNLPHKEWHYAKGEIFEIVQKYEFNLIMNQQPNN